MTEIEKYIKNSLKILNIDESKISNKIIIEYNKLNKIIYNYKLIVIYETHKRDISHYVLVKTQNNLFQYQEWKGNTPTNLSIKKIVNIESIIDANNIITSFVKDSYYNSPINFCNMKKLSEDKENFDDNYKKYDKFYYMGLYSKYDKEVIKMYVKKKDYEYEYLSIA